MGKVFSEKGKKLLIRRILPAGVILAAFTGCAYAVNSAQYSDRFLPGTVIDGVDVSNLTFKEAESGIKAAKDNYELTIRFRGGSEEKLTKDDVGLGYDCSAELMQLMNDQNRYAWLSRELGGSSNISLKTPYTVDEDEFSKAINALPELKDGNYAAPVNAKLMLGNDGLFTMRNEIEGSEIRTTALADVAKAAIAEGQTVLDLTSDAAEGVYEEPEVTSENESLSKRMKKLNKFLSAKVTLRMSDGTERVVDSKITKNWITLDKNGEFYVDDSAVYRQARRYIADMAKADDNYGFFRSFASTNYGMQKFHTDSIHGHSLNQTAMAKALTKYLLKGKTATLDPVYLQCIDVLDPHFGGTYVEVDIYEQHVYCYKEGELVFDCNCVTGTESYSRTPSGIFSIDEKVRGRRLEGYNSAGQKTYSVWVNFWICFYPHYGLHDASWRGSFGGDIYTYDGSHGCVNLSYSSAEAIYDLMDYGTPVIILRGEV